MQPNVKQFSAIARHVRRGATHHTPPLPSCAHLQFHTQLDSGAAVDAEGERRNVICVQFAAVV